MAEISPELKTQGSRAFWLLVVLALGAWFYNEAMTTKRTLREESSLMFSNLASQYKNIYSKYQNKNAEVNKDFLESEKRFETELNRLITEFEDSPYSNLGKVLAGAHDLVKNPGKVNPEHLVLKDNENANRMTAMASELSELIKARSLLSSQENAKIEEGKTLLISLIKESKLLPVEAAVSYFMSIKNNPAEKLSGLNAVEKLIKDRPEFKEDIEQELSRFGIYVPMS